MKKGEQAVEESIAVVRRQFLEGGEPLGPPTETNETIEVHRFVVEPAKIQVGRGLTLNLGNYESAGRWDLCPLLHRGSRVGLRVGSAVGRAAGEERGQRHSW
jgi:hypothetical protein